MNDLSIQTAMKTDYLKKYFDHFTKYSFVGIGNLIFTLALYIIFLKILNFKYDVAFTLSWLFGVLFTYIINFGWVFKPEEKITFKKRLLKYFLVYIISYLLNLFLLRFLVESFSFQPLLAQILIIPFVVVINFSGIKYWALKLEI